MTNKLREQILIEEFDKLPKDKQGVLVYYYKHICMYVKLYILRVMIKFIPTELLNNYISTIGNTYVFRLTNSF